MGVKIFHANDSAVCFESDESRILIDCIYCCDSRIKGVGMSPMPPEFRDMMRNGTGVFENPDLIAFTHSHIDHYDEEEISGYLEKNKDVLYFAPGDERNNVQIVKENGFDVIKHKDFELVILDSEHVDMGDIVEPVPVCSMLVRYKDCSYFIASDSVLDSEVYDRFSAVIDKPVKYAFFNVMQMSLDESREFIRRLNPQKAVLYHLPEKEDDDFGFYGLARTLKKKYPEDLPEYITAEHMSSFE